MPGGHGQTDSASGQERRSRVQENERADVEKGDAHDEGNCIGFLVSLHRRRPPHVDTVVIVLDASLGREVERPSILLVHPDGESSGSLDVLDREHPHPEEGRGRHRVDAHSLQ